jgi:hypothetical protein
MKLAHEVLLQWPTKGGQVVAWAGPGTSGTCHGVGFGRESLMRIGKP